MGRGVARSLGSSNSVVLEGGGKYVHGDSVGCIRGCCSKEFHGRRENGDL